MIKRTLYFGNPTYLALHNKQLVIKMPEVESNSQELIADVERVYDVSTYAKVLI